MLLPLHDHENLAQSLRTDVVLGLRRPRTLHELVADRWVITEIFEQDEFTRDVVISVESGIYAVYDAT